jgi:hypothetical protein
MDLCAACFNSSKMLMRGKNFGRRVKRQSHGQNVGNVFELRVAIPRLRMCHKDGASKTRPVGMDAMGLNSHKNAHAWKGVLPEEQSVRARMARPIRMDAGILCDRAEPAFTLHILTATPHTLITTRKPPAGGFTLIRPVRSRFASPAHSSADPTSPSAGAAAR